MEAGRTAMTPPSDQTVTSVSDQTAAARAMLLLAFMLALLKTQTDDATARKRNTEEQDARDDIYR